MYDRTAKNEYTNQQGYTLEEYVNEVLAEQEKWRNKYEQVITEAVKQLEQLLAPSGIPVAFISGRVKSADSLKEKIYRKNFFSRTPNPTNAFRTLSDGIGIRIVCILSQDEKRIYEYLRSQMTVMQKSKINGFHCYGTDDSESARINIVFEGQPQKQSNRLDIYRMDCYWTKKGKRNIQMELQIKGLADLLWGEVEHSLFYKNYDYIISKDFYEEQMKELYENLEAVDRQIVRIQKYMDNNTENTSSQIHQMAGYFLFGYFDQQVRKCIQCQIDLGAAYNLITDLYMQFEEKPANLFRMLSVMDTEVENANPMSEMYDNLYGVLILDQAMDSNLRKICELVDGRIKAGDIFWRVFIAIYLSIRRIDIDEPYTEKIRLVSEDLYGLIRKNCQDMPPVFLDALTDTLCRCKKLGYFSVHKYLLPVRRKADHVLDLLKDGKHPEESRQHYAMLCRWIEKEWDAKK